MSTSEQVKQSEVKQEQGEDSHPTTTKVVTKQKDPKRVAMGRQLGLRNKAFKFKKQKMMKSEKEEESSETSRTRQACNKTMMIGLVGLGVLGLVYFVYSKLRQSLRLPTLTPAIIEQRDSFEKRQREEVSPAKIVIPTTPKIVTGVVNME